MKIKVNKARMKWAQDILHESEGIFAGPMLNETWVSNLVPGPNTARCIVRDIVRRGHSWPMWRMTRDRVDVYWKMRLKSGLLRDLDRCLARNDGIHFRS